MLSDNLRKDIRNLWDKFWSRGITNPITAIEQISYLLFMRRLEETDADKLANTSKSKEKYSSLFVGKFEHPIQSQDGKPLTIDKQELRWRAFKALKGEELVDRISNWVFPFIKQLNGEQQPYTRYMKNAVFIINNPNLLEDVIEDIDKIFQHVKDDKTKKGRQFQDTQGDIYEYLLSQLSLSGKNGQFRTPRHLIHLICELVDPKKTDTICDPACGTGGFLLGAYQHILTENTSEEHLVIDEDGFKKGSAGNLLKKPDWNRLQTDTFFGFDIDQNMIRIGLMNMLLHDISQPQMENVDGLSKDFDEYLEKSKHKQFSVILANPPFSGKISEKDKSLKFTKEDGKDTALLFLKRSISMLKPGGKAGIIVPEGVLFGSNKSARLTRESLLRNCQVSAVVSLPTGVFRPYAGVKTAILLFTKPEKEEKSRYASKEVWFYEVKSDGYSLDDQRKPLHDRPLPEIVEDFKKSKGKAKGSNRQNTSFIVPINDIRDFGYNLSMNRYKETKYIPEKFDPPKETIQPLIALEEEIYNELKELSDLIK